MPLPNISIRIPRSDLVVQPSPRGGHYVGFAGTAEIPPFIHLSSRRGALEHDVAIHLEVASHSNGKNQPPCIVSFDNDKQLQVDGTPTQGMLDALAVVSRDLLNALHELERPGYILLDDINDAHALVRSIDRQGLAGLVRIAAGNDVGGATRGIERPPAGEFS